MNQVLLNTFYKGNDDEILQPHLLFWIDSNPKNLEMKRKLKNLIEEYPKTMELSENFYSPNGNYHVKVLYVRFIQFILGKN